MSAPRLLFLVTEDWYFWSHRLPVARAARDAGYRVIIACRVGRHGPLIEKEGFKLVPLSLRRRSLNPFREAAALREIAKIYKKEKPAIVHHVGLKPILYGSIAARLAGVDGVVNAFAGLGHAFAGRGPARRAVRLMISRLLRAALAGVTAKVIVQNREDAAALVKARIVREEDLVLIPGAGVDLSRFAAGHEPAGAPLVVLPSRMIRDKGVAVFVKAAQLLRAEGTPARFALVGEPDPDNPASIKSSELAAWSREGHVEVWGRTEDMPGVLAKAHVVCLPSMYGEGVPKILLEAAAAGRPAVTTDMPGCRDAVRDEETGLLVAPGDARALARALRRLIDDADLRGRMGARARGLAEARFSDVEVAARTLEVYKSVLEAA